MIIHNNDYEQIQIQISIPKYDTLVVDVYNNLGVISSQEIDSLNLTQSEDKLTDILDIKYSQLNECQSIEQCITVITDLYSYFYLLDSLTLNEISSKLN